MPDINDYLKPGACVPVDSDTTIALVEEIIKLRRECDVLARENAKYEERHKAWEAAVYCVDPAPIMKAVRTSEYGDEALPVPQVRRIIDLLDVMNKMREALSYCAKDPWMMHPQEQAQFMIAREALNALKEKP